MYGSTHHVCMCVCVGGGGGGGGVGWLCCHKAVAWHRDQSGDCDMCSQDSVFGDSGCLREDCDMCSQDSVFGDSGCLRELC